MKNLKKKRIMTAIFVGLFAVVCTVNLLVLFAKPAFAADYTMKYIANNVWHCDTGGEMGCDTPSSHVWKPQ
jgi:hypothetical protein